MPDPKSCKEAGLTPGTKEYEDCVGYKNKYEKNKKVKSDKNIVPGKRY